jgi:type IV fimbrial biogenesis protein FimT
MNYGGFSLLDLLVTLTIASILFGIGVPNFYDLTANNRLTVATNELITSLHYARSEAVTREVPVSICASEDGQSCSGTSDWGRGWVVFTDSTGSNGVLDSGDELLYTNLTEGDGITIAALHPYVRYSATGRPID